MNGEFLFDDFETSERDEAMERALMDSRVRRNLDKPCRTVPVPTSQHSAVKNTALLKDTTAVSDQMK